MERLLHHEAQVLTSNQLSNINDDDDQLPEEPQAINFFITEEGLKRQSGIDYTSKFKDINWTADIERELPIKIAYDK